MQKCGINSMHHPITSYIYIYVFVKALTTAEFYPPHCFKHDRSMEFIILYPQWNEDEQFYSMK
jgi:hypothetical protein